MELNFGTNRVRWFAALLTVFLLLFGVSATVFAQGGPRGAIDGFVKDPSGAVIQHATIQIVNQATGVTERTVNSGNDGHFVAALLPVGFYRLVVTAPATANFAKTEATGVEVRVTETTAVTIVMKPGGATETVEVSGVASEVNVVNPTTGVVIGSHTASNLPLVTRNFFALLALSSGANSEIFDTAALGRGAVSINVNGQRPTNNNYQLEGINANDFNLPVLDEVPLPNPDTIQEFKTQTSLYDASTGRNGGGNIQVSLKSGGQNWHGDAYGFYRSDKFNANDWFLKRNQIEHDEPNTAPRLHQNQYGGSIGGPVPLGKNWFIFGNYQGTSATSGISAGTLLSTNITAIPADRSAGSLMATFFPGGPAAWGLASTATVDPVVLSLLNHGACGGFSDSHCIPTVLPTIGGSAPGVVGAPGGTAPSDVRGSVVASNPGPFDESQFTISSDKSIGNKDKITGRFFYSHDTTAQPFGGGSSLAYPEGFPLDNRFLKLGWTHILSSDKVNDLRFGFNRYVFVRQPSEAISAADIGQTRPNVGDFPGMSRFAITSDFSVGINQNDDRGTRANAFNYVDDFSWTKGKHALRMGVNIDQYQLNRYNNFATRGSQGFNSTAAGATGPFGQPVGAANAACPTPPCALSAFQNFLLGRVTSTQAESGIATYYFRAIDYGTYFQDDWKIKPRLTLNLGLRWEFLSIAHDKRGFGTNFIFNGAQNPPIQEVHPASFPGALATPGVPDCTIQTCLYKKGLEPRLGFAYDLFGNQKTVVRGGFGIYYDRTSNQSLLQTTGGLPFQLAVAAPGAMQVSTADPFPNLIPLSQFPVSYGDVFPTLAAFRTATGADPRGILATNAALAGAPIFNSANGLPPAAFYFQPVQNLIPPRIMQWNFTVQREVAKNWLAEVGYVGTRGDNLLGPGGLLDFSQYCNAFNKCQIPAVMGQNVVVAAGTPDVTKNADGSIFITGSTANNANARVPAQYLGLAENHFALNYNGGFSTYHSLQASILHRFSSGLYLQGAYTYSKCLDNGSGSTFQDELNGLILWGDETSIQATRGLCDFDRQHRFSGSWNYELPLGKWLGADNHGIGRLAFGWALNGLVTWQTGTPFMVFDSSAISLTDVNANNGAYFATFAPGATKSTAQVSGGGCTVGSVDCFINLAAFLPGGNCIDSQLNVTAPPASGCPGFSANGNVGRNIYRGPRQFNMDFSVAKNTKITEKTNLELRAEFFNIFNHPAFQSPQGASSGCASLPTGCYGTVNVAAADSSIIGTANRPRIMQFGAKFSF
jgi:hypothetical protein